MPTGLEKATGLEKVLRLQSQIQSGEYRLEGKPLTISFEYRFDSPAVMIIKYDDQDYLLPGYDYEDSPSRYFRVTKHDDELAIKCYVFDDEAGSEAALLRLNLAGGRGPKYIYFVSRKVFLDKNSNKKVENTEFSGDLTSAFLSQ